MKMNFNEYNSLNRRQKIFGNILLILVVYSQIAIAIIETPVVIISLIVTIITNKSTAKMRWHLSRKLNNWLCNKIDRQWPVVDFIKNF